MCVHCTVKHVMFKKLILHNYDTEHYSIKLQDGNASCYQTVLRVRISCDADPVRGSSILSNADPDKTNSGTGSHAI